MAVNHSPNSLSVQTSNHPTGLIVVPFRVGDFYTLDLILNTGFVISAVSQSTHDVLSALGYLHRSGGRSFLLQDLRLSDQPVDALEVRVNAGLRILRFEGVVGLNFLNRFREIHFDVQSRRLTLTFP